MKVVEVHPVAKNCATNGFVFSTALITDNELKQHTII